MSDCIVHLFTISKISQHKLKAGPLSIDMLGSYTVITHLVCSFLDARYLFSLIHLSHYSRNAPRIHNVGHFFQMAKVPSGICKFRPACVLDSMTFVAIGKCSEMQLRVENLFHFHQYS